MKYRALVCIKGIEMPGKKKREREEYHLALMKTLLKYWDSREPYPEYFDPTYDTDSVYDNILNTGFVNGKKNINIDDPLKVMNAIGKENGHVFYTSIPKSDKKNREKAKQELSKLLKKEQTQLTDADKRKISNLEYETIEPVCAKKTKLYAYSKLNPNGMFSEYSYPIENVYNIDLDASKLINRNYGTSHDILKLQDLDFEATYLPNVIFRFDGEVLESYPDDVEGGDPQEVFDFLHEKFNPESIGYVAMIECTV